MNSGGSHGTARLTAMARNCVWPTLRSRLLEPAPVAVADTAVSADAVADMAVADDAR